LVDLLAAWLLTDHPKSTREMLKSLEWRVTPDQLARIPAPMLIALEWTPQQATGSIDPDAPTGPMSFDAAIQYALKLKAKRDAEKEPG
jgi:hypothetical protein